MSQAARQHFTFSDYVDLEEISTVKHEYLAGEVWAMAGGSPQHAAIAANVVAALISALGDRPCRVFSSDLRVRVKATGLGTYPDAAVVCERLELDPEDPKGHTVINPQVVVEVTSPSTLNYDHGEKLHHYFRIEALQEVVLVAQDDPCIEVWRRDGATWSVSTARAHEHIQLPSLGCVLSVDAVYRDPLAR